MKKSNSETAQNQEDCFCGGILGNFSFQYDTFLSKREQSLKNNNAGLFIVDEIIPSKKRQDFASSHQLVIGENWEGRSGGRDGTSRGHVSVSQISDVGGRP